VPHSGYTICTSEQRPTSTAVSHGFVVVRYSSPPFGSHGPCNHSKPCPLDCGTGALCREEEPAAGAQAATTRATAPPHTHNERPAMNGMMIDWWTPMASSPHRLMMMSLSAPPHMVVVCRGRLRRCCRGEGPSSRTTPSRLQWNALPSPRLLGRFSMITPANWQAP